MRFGGAIACDARRGGQPLEVLPRIVVEVVVVRVLLLPLLDLLVGRCRHVEQERHRHVALDLVPPPVHLVAERVPGLALDRVLDDRVQVEVLAVQQVLDLAEHLRLQQLELLARLVHQPRVLAQRVLVVLVRALVQRPLEDRGTSRGL